MADLFAGLTHCTFKVHCDVTKYFLEVENTVMVLVHHSQLDESEFELSLPKPQFSFCGNRDAVECPADLPGPPGHGK